MIISAYRRIRRKRYYKNLKDENFAEKDLYEY